VEACYVHPILMCINANHVHAVTCVYNAETIDAELEVGQTYNAAGSGFSYGQRGC
jgi:hypothetical protein